MEDYRYIPNSLDYGVSDSGVIVRFPYEKLHNINKTYFTTKLKILVPSTNNSKGYQRILIRYKNKNKTESVHRLVAQIFVPNPENKPQVNHKNGNKLDNHFSNLE